MNLYKPSSQSPPARPPTPILPEVFWHIESVHKNHTYNDSDFERTRDGIDPDLADEYETFSEVSISEDETLPNGRLPDITAWDKFLNGVSEPSDSEFSREEYNVDNISAYSSSDDLYVPKSGQPFSVKEVRRSRWATLNPSLAKRFYFAWWNKVVRIGTEYVLYASLRSFKREQARLESQEGGSAATSGPSQDRRAPYVNSTGSPEW